MYFWTQINRDVWSYKSTLHSVMSVHSWSNCCTPSIRDTTERAGWVLVCVCILDPVVWLYFRGCCVSSHWQHHMDATEEACLIIIIVFPYFETVLCVCILDCTVFPYYRLFYVPILWDYITWLYFRLYYVPTLWDCIMWLYFRLYYDVTVF